MPRTVFPRVPPEPAHSTLVRLRQGLVAVYTRIREDLQTQIDHVFDQVSRDIGFVVTTSVPYNIEVGDSRLKGIIITDGLQGTIFDRELSPIVQVLCDDPVPVWAEAGIQELYVFWYEALKLRLQTDWVEPAHYRGRMLPSRLEREVMWDVREPAHWFDPGIAIEREEAVLISVIDEVYPELRLVDRVSRHRQVLGHTGTLLHSLSELVDPRPELGEPAPQGTQPPAEILTEVAALLRRYGY